MARIARPLRRLFSRFFRVQSEQPGNFRTVNGIRLFDKYQSLKEDFDLQNKFLKEEAIHVSKLKSAISSTYLEGLVEKSLGRTDSRAEDHPEKIGDYYYYTRHKYIEDKDYVVVYRYKKNRDVDSELVFDAVQEKAVSKRHIQSFQINKLALSDCQSYLGIIIDTENNERPKGFVKNLTTGALLPERVSDCTNFIFSKDNRFLYYTRLDQNNRPFAVYKHRIGDKGLLSDVAVFEEPDQKYFVDIQLTKSKDYYIILSSAKESFKIHLLERKAQESFSDAEKVFPVQISSADERILSFQKTAAGCFAVQHKDDTSSILYVSNESFAGGVQKLKARRSASSKPGNIFTSSFEPKVICTLPKEETLTECDIFESCILLYITSGGINKILKISIPDFRSQELTFAAHADEQYGNIAPASNMDADPKACIFYHDSPFVFNETYEIDLIKDKITKKEDFEAGGSSFNPQAYKATLIHVPSRDGSKIPMWALHHHSIDPLRPKYLTKCFMRFYGCYGLPTDLGFSITDWNFLEENWVLLFPLIRGGGDFGPSWHQQAIRTKKFVSIADIEDAAKYAIGSGLTHSSLLCAKSNSAGAGLLAACVNRAPHLFKAVVLDAPFLDILGLLLDKDMPLSQSDYEEFGNPENEAHLKSLLSICPYTNVRSAEYPSVLINCYEDDYRTPVWQILKWARKVRDLADKAQRVSPISGSNVFVNYMAGSHNGAGSRKETIELRCLELAFLTTIIKKKSLDYMVERKLKVVG